MDCSLPGSSAHRILQARILEWVAMPSSRGSSLPRDQTRVSSGPCNAGRFFTTEPPGKPLIDPIQNKKFFTKSRTAAFSNPFPSHCDNHQISHTFWKGRQALPLGEEDPLMKGMATHSSILAWRILWTEEPDRLQSMGQQRVVHHSSFHTYTRRVNGTIAVCV